MSPASATLPAAARAKDDIAIWQDRIDRKMTKVGDNWLTDDERREFAKALTGALSAARLSFP